MQLYTLYFGDKAKLRMKYFIQQNMIRIPAAIYVVGFLVHNFYLSSFQIYDFELLQARYIYTGFVSTLFILTIYLFTFLKLDLTNHNNNISLKGMYLWAYRVSLVCIFFYMSLLLEEGSQLYIPPLQGVLSDQMVTKLIFVFPSVLLFFTVVADSEYVGDHKLRGKPTSIVTYVASPVVIITLFLLAYYNDRFASVLLFFFFLWFSAVMLMATLVDSASGITVKHLDINTEDVIQTKFGNLLSWISLIILVLMLLNIYAKRIYPLISTSLGGGKPINAEIQTDEKSYVGMLISEGKFWTYIQGNENIYKIKASKINEVKLIYKDKNIK